MVLSATHCHSLVFHILSTPDLHRADADADADTDADRLATWPSRSSLTWTVSLPHRVHNYNHASANINLHLNLGPQTTPPSVMWAHSRARGGLYLASSRAVVSSSFEAETCPNSGSKCASTIRHPPSAIRVPRSVPCPCSLQPLLCSALLCSAPSTGATATSRISSISSSHVAPQSP